MPSYCCDQIGLIVGLLMRDRILRHQSLIALEVGLRLRQQPLIVGELAFGLGLGDFIGARVDLRQEVALVDQLPFGESDVGQLAADLGLHGDGGERGHGAERVDHDADIARRDRRRADRLQPARGRARIGRLRGAGGMDDHIGRDDEAYGNGEAKTDAQFRIRPADDVRLPRRPAKIGRQFVVACACALVHLGVQYPGIFRIVMGAIIPALMKIR